LLSELNAIHRPVLGQFQCTFSSSQAGGRDLQPGRPKPGIRDLEAAVDFTQDRGFRHAAVIELENAIGITAMRNVFVAGPDLEARVPHVDQECRHLFAAALGGR
jgi:hypothetical protein